jgi:hypothetical protein
LAWNSTCFGRFLCPSSGVYSLYTQQWYMSYRFVDGFRAGPGPARKPSSNKICYDARSHECKIAFIFLRTHNIFTFIFWKTHISSYNFSDSIQFNVGCYHITLFLLLDLQARFLHIISKNTKQKYCTLSNTPSLS